MLIFLTQVWYNSKVSGIGTGRNKDTRGDSVINLATEERGQPLPDFCGINELMHNKSIPIHGLFVPD